MTVLTPYQGEVDELMIMISFTFLKYTRDDFTKIHTYIYTFFDLTIRKASSDRNQ